MTKLDFAEKCAREFDELPQQNISKLLQKFNHTSKGEPFALCFLLQKGGACPIDMSMAAGCSAARISALLESLEKKGLVQRALDKNDRRRTLVSLTEQGETIAKTIWSNRTALLHSIFTEMGEKDSKEFLRLTTKFFETAMKSLEELGGTL